MASKPDLSLSGWGPYPGGDDLGAVVAEVGSYSTKMGYAGEDHPRAIFRTECAALRGGGGSDGGSGGGRRRGKIGRLNHCDWWNRPFEGDGSDGRWEVATPVEGGTGLIYEAPAGGSPSAAADGTDDAPPGSANSNDAPPPSSKKSTLPPPSSPDDAESPAGSPGHGECHRLLTSYLEHGFSSCLPTSPSDSPFILVERSYNPPPLRQKSLEILFEALDVPAAFLARDAVTACYAAGRATGTVVDVGHTGTVVTPVFDGYVEGRGVLRSGTGTAGLAVDGEVLRGLDGLVSHDRAARRKARKKLHAAVAAASSAAAEGGAGEGGAGAAAKWEKWRDEIDFAMPLYQTRSRRERAAHARRSEAMHSFARLDLARQCKEAGIGAAVAEFGYVASASHPDGGGGEGDAAGSESDGGGPGEEARRLRDQYANAPGMMFDLPDGTVVEVPQLTRYDASEVLFGTDPLSSKKREEGVAEVRSKLNEVLAASSAAAKSGSGGGGGNEGGGGGAADAYDDMGSTISSTGLRSVRSKERGGGSRRRTAARSHATLVRSSLPYLTSQLPELTSAPLQAMVCDSAFRCDRDQQAQLLGNVVLCGGGACLGPDDSSLPDRLRDEVEALIHAHTPGWRVKVLAADRRERRYASWLGASILGSLGMFSDFWISKAEYEEFGPGIANRKCP